MAIPAIPTTLLSGNITLVDVLGKKMGLSYSDFRHWPVFEAMLHVAFKGLPGERRVQRERYYIIEQGGKILAPDVVIESGLERGICPACGAKNSSAINTSPWLPLIWYVYVLDERACGEIDRL